MIRIEDPELEKIMKDYHANDADRVGDGRHKYRKQKQSKNIPTEEERAKLIKKYLEPPKKVKLTFIGEPSVDYYGSLNADSLKKKKHIYTEAEKRSFIRKKQKEERRRKTKELQEKAAVRKEAERLQKEKYGAFTRYVEKPGAKRPRGMGSIAKHLKEQNDNTAVVVHGDSSVFVDEYERRLTATSIFGYGRKKSREQGSGIVFNTRQKNIKNIRKRIEKMEAKRRNIARNQAVKSVLSQYRKNLRAMDANNAAALRADLRRQKSTRMREGLDGVDRGALK